METTQQNLTTIAKGRGFLYAHDDQLYWLSLFVADSLCLSVAFLSRSYAIYSDLLIIIIIIIIVVYYFIYFSTYYYV